MVQIISYKVLLWPMITTVYRKYIAHLVQQWLICTFLKLNLSMCGKTKRLQKEFNKRCKYVILAPNERHIHIIKYSYINYICVVYCSRAVTCWYWNCVLFYIYTPFIPLTQGFPIFSWSGTSFIEFLLAGTTL